MADFDQLFVDQLNATLTGNLQKLNLRLDKKIECHLRYE
jgi:hypothetical protein